MKKTIYMIIIITFCVLLSGCVTYNMNNSVNEDRSYTISAIYGQKNNKTGFFQPPSEEKLEKYREQGYIVSIENLDENNSVGRFIYEIEDINSLCVEEAPIITLDDFMYDDINSILEKGVFSCQEEENKKTYSAHFQYHYRFLDSEDYETGERMWMYPDQFSDGNEYKAYMIKDTNLKYEIELQKGTMISNNATIISDDNKKFTWELSPEGMNDIIFSFEILNDVEIDYKEKDIEILSETSEQGEEIHFKVKNFEKLKEIIILDEKNNKIEVKKVPRSNDEYFFIMPTTNVKINIEYRVINPETLSGVGIIINLLTIFIILGFTLLNMKKIINKND